MINACIVGTGAIATQHIRAFKELGGVGVQWIISRRVEAARDFSHHWQIERFGTELDVALGDSAVNLVVITSPSELHVDQTICSLRAGKDVIVEIPVALSLADTERIVDLAQKLQRRVLVCHTMRSFPAIREVRRRVQRDELHLSHIIGFFAIPRRNNQGMSGQRRNWIDNLLWHHGCHMVDVAMWVLGVTSVKHVSAILGDANRQFGMIMDASVHFCTDKRQLVSNALTYNTGQFCWEVHFMGDEESLIYKNGRLSDEEGVQVIRESSWVDLVPQDKEMLESIAQGTPSEYDINTVLAPMKVLHQAEVSAAA